jgi:hypothetical protein
VGPRCRAASSWGDLRKRRTSSLHKIRSESETAAQVRHQRRQVLPKGRSPSRAAWLLPWATSGLPHRKKVSKKFSPEARRVLFRNLWLR